MGVHATRGDGVGDRPSRLRLRRGDTTRPSRARRGHLVGALLPTSPPVVSADGVDQCPLVGRANELEWIDRARAARVSGAVVVGDVGVGKTRLARTALAQAERDGALALWVQATQSAATVPLGAFAGVIPFEVRRDDPFELLRSSSAALTELAETRPLVVGIDDAQLLDPASAALVLHLADRGTCFVIATIRTGENCPDAIVSLWKDAGAERVELSPLGEDEIAEIVETIVGGPVEERIHRWVWDTSEGNPLYAHDLVLSALRSEALTEVSGLWRMRSCPPLSASLTEAISAQLGDLTSAERRVLELLALGEPLSVAEVVEMADENAAATVEAQGLIRIQESDLGSEVRLAHPLYRETIRAGLGTLHAADLRSALAACVGARRELALHDALRVACWLRDAGAPIPSALLITAARAANLSGDPDLGASFAGRAVAAGAGADAALLLAQANALRKRFGEAELVLAGLEHERRTQDEAIAYLELRAPLLYWALQRPEDARALLARAERWWPDGVWRQRLVPLRVHVGDDVERSAVALARLEQTLGDERLDERIRQDYIPIHAARLFHRGNVAEAHALIRRLAPIRASDQA